MSTTPETSSPDSNSFDLDAIDQNSYEAAPRAIVDELFRIAELADDAVLLLRLPYKAHISGTEAERALYDLDIASCLEAQADALSTQTHLDTIRHDTSGAYAGQRVFLNAFHNLPAWATMDELADAIEARRQYMTTLRMVNEYGVTLGEYRALQETVELDEASMDMTTQTDKAAFAQLLLMQQQYQAGDRNG